MKFSNRRNGGGARGLAIPGSRPSTDRKQVTIRTTEGWTYFKG